MKALAGDLPAALAGAGSAYRRGWVLAALGRYGQALDTLASALDGPGDVAVRAHVTRGSVLRQVGLHAEGAREDEQGLARLPVAADAEAALRVSLVADAVGGLIDGHGDAALLDSRLATARAAVGAAPGWRQQVRLAWVTGEVAMVRGEHAAAAGAFEDARTRAVAAGARRHESKSLLFAAAAAGAAGDHAWALETARAARDLADRCAAAPLGWPAELVAADALARLDQPAEAAAARRRPAAGLEALLGTLPAGLATHARSRPVAAALLTALPPA
jgi:tetratricopeptide (TPR) repeat protein